MDDWAWLWQNSYSLTIRKLPDGTIPRADSIVIHWPTAFALVTIAGLTTILSSLLPVIRGRMIRDDHTAAAPFVAVINQTPARRYFAGRDPIVQQIDVGGKDTGMIKPYRIVGVLADQTDDRVSGAVQRLILLPQRQIPVTSLFYQALLKTVVSFVVQTRTPDSPSSWLWPGFPAAY